MFFKEILYTHDKICNKATKQKSTLGKWQTA